MTREARPASPLPGERRMAAAPSPDAAHSDQRTLKGEATRSRLLTEAMRLFAERGYEGVSTRALAEAAASNVALITFHFGSKRGLYEATIAAVEQRLDELMTPSVNRLRHSLAEYGDQPDRLMDMLRALTGDLLFQLLSTKPRPGFFQLLSRAMREQDALSERLWGLFIPILHSMEDVLVAASSPELRHKARLAAFLHIVAMLGVVQDYKIFLRHLHDNNDLACDAATLADLLCSSLSVGFPPSPKSPARSVPC